MNYSRKAYLAAAIFAVALSGSLTSCQNEDETLARAVLASAESLTFKGEDAAPQMITVYSDAQWVAEVPEWVTIEPQTGSGTTEVTVSVSDNIRDNALDNPRSGNLVFKGSTLDSRDIVVVNQEGDKYRDVKNYTVSEAVAAENGTVIIMPESQVVAVTTAGFIVSDNTSNIYVEGIPEEVKCGDNVSFRGTRSVVSGLPAVSGVEYFSISGNSAVTYPEAKDISAELDEYSSSAIEYITVTGIMTGSSVTVDGATFSVSVQNAPESFGISSLNNHTVTVKGYFSGLATPFINIILTDVEDKGVYELVYFSDDFSWLQKYVDACEANGEKVSDSVTEKNTGSDGARNIYTFATLTDMGLLEDLRARGYKDLNPDMETIYLQKYYFKFGATDKQSGLTLPPFDEETFTEESDDILVTFQWCTQVGGSGKPDTSTEMVVEIVDGPGTVEGAQDADGKISASITTTQEVNKDDPQFFWMDASVKIIGATVDTRISIHPLWMGGKGGPSKYMRYYMDNIKIVPAE